MVGSFEQIACKGAFFLSRLRPDTKRHDPRTGRELNLLGRLKAQGTLERKVWLGSQRMPVRLVALKLPPQVAAERRREARMNRDKRCNPSARSLQLLGRSNFVTHVPRKNCGTKTIDPR
jgi:hypothetical protein